VPIIPAQRAAHSPAAGPVTAAAAPDTPDGWPDTPNVRIIPVRTESDSTDTEPTVLQTMPAERSVAVLTWADDLSRMARTWDRPAHVPRGPGRPAVIPADAPVVPARQADARQRNVSPRQMGRRVEGPVRRDLGRWRVLPCRGGLGNDRGPQADAEERIRSAHRAIEIREKRRGVLSSFCLDYLALQPTSSVNDVPVTVHAIAWWTRRMPLIRAHRWSWAPVTSACPGQMYPGGGSCGGFR
jgi:hypothetical protein